MAVLILAKPLRAKVRRQRGLGALICAALVLLTSARAQEVRPGVPGEFLQAGVGRPEQSGSISGSVTDAAGVPIVGAALTLTLGDGAGKHSVLSDGDGRFVVGDLPAGRFHVSVSFAGFDGATAEGDLHAGEAVELSPLALKLSTVKIDVDAAVPTEEIAAEELHVEEKQRLLGIAPNFFVSYKWDAAPLTAGQKFKLAWKNVSDPGNLLLVGTVAGFQQATDEFNGYGQGAAGYGRRYGADLGNLVVGTFMGGAVLPSLFHQDPRYFYKGTGSFKSRLAYALESAVICRGDNGKRQFAWAGVLGDLSAGAISNTYYAREDRHGAALTLENGFLGVAGDALNGLVQEFFFKQITAKAKKKK